MILVLQRSTNGLIRILSSSQKENPLQIKIIEIYTNQKTYKSHLHTPHFQHYKTTTLKKCLNP
ncbi:putative quinol monooxygenase [Chryseobacterium sp. 3008163]|uniref:putative quinol monooxygenase n=1 Tax=Chryseobacterium sp. 3008163 TaxID=2478663 RepID=UPI0039774859